MIRKQASADTSAYDSFAWFYNKYWGREIAFQMLSALEVLLVPAIPAGSRILDLCCGTGRLAALLGKRGFKVTGIDNSAAMLAFARRNAPAARFIRARAQSFKVPSVYQAAISTFDSLNHIMSLKELTEVFRRVSEALVEDGLFVFDLHTEEGFRHHWQEHRTIVETDAACILRGRYDQEAKVGRYDVTVFRLAKQWRRYDFVLLERCYSQREVRAALKTAGFITVSTYSAARDLGLTEHTGRWFFVARKTTSEDGER